MKSKWETYTNWLFEYKKEIAEPSPKAGETWYILTWEGLDPSKVLVKYISEKVVELEYVGLHKRIFKREAIQFLERIDV